MEVEQILEQMTIEELRSLAFNFWNRGEPNQFIIDLIHQKAMTRMKLRELVRR
jgi:hypothetical protein